MTRKKRTSIPIEVGPSHVTVAITVQDLVLDLALRDKFRVCRVQALGF